MKHVFALLTTAILIGGCASTNTPAPSNQATDVIGYTSAEKLHMTGCVALTDDASRIALMKLTGASLGMAEGYYMSKDHNQLKMPLVKKVYADTFFNEWDYSVSFFNECAAKQAKVTQPRVRMASYCMQNVLIAGIAYDYKELGKPREAAQAHFAGFNADTPRLIVDQVYASSGSRSQVEMSNWDSCMSRLTED
jgi:hypothetical protein